MEKTFSKVKVIWMTILSLVILFTGVLFVNMDKSNTQSQVSTVVSADTVSSTAPTLDLPIGATKWDEVFELTNDGTTTTITGVKDEYLNITELNVILDDNTTGDVLIKQKAFANLTNLTTVVISLKNPTLLESSLLDGCTNLEYIYFNTKDNVDARTYGSGTNVTSDYPFDGTYGNNCHLIICEGELLISKNLFQYSSSIHEITISKDVRGIDLFAFACNSGLKKINYNVKYHDDYVTGLSPFFKSGSSDGCILYIGDEVDRIPFGLFSLSFINDIVFLGNNCKILESQVFLQVPVNSVDLSDSGIVELGDGVFGQCIYLESIILPNTLETIGENAFAITSLKEISIPASVKFIGEDCFLFCNKLEHIAILGSVTNGDRTEIPTITENSFQVEKVFVPYDDYDLYQASANYSNPDNISNLLPYDYEVTFKFNDGVNPDFVDKLDINADGSIDSHTITTPVRDGYVITGWYTDDLFTQSSGLNPTADGTGFEYSLNDFQGPTTLYAKWERIGYTITIGNKVNNSKNEIIFYDGDVIQLSTLNNNNFTIDGYEFKEFYLIPDGISFDNYIFNSDDIITSELTGINKDINVIAKFDAIEYTITYEYWDATNNTTISNLPNSAKFSIKNVIILDSTKEVIRGYNFSRFSLNGNQITSTDGIFEDITVRVEFNVAQYDITYDNLYDGKHNNPETYTINDSNITLIDASRDGYIFQGWYDKNNPSSKVETIYTSSCKNYELKAEWIAIQYKITLTNNINADTKEVEFNIETTDLWLSLNSAKFVFNGYAFDGFYLGGKKLVEDDVEGLSKSITVLAQFSIETYKIIYELGDGDWKVGYEPTQDYTVTTPDIILPNFENIVPPVGYEFVGWKNDVNTPIEKIPYGSTGLCYLVADYVAIEYEITYKYVDLIGGEELNNQDIEDNNGTKFSVEHPIDFVGLKKLGYDFIGFTVDNVAVNSTSGMFEDIVVLGIFKIHDYEIKYANAENAKNDNPETYTIKDDNIVLKPAIKEGYDFLGWFKQGTSTDELVTEIDTSQLVDYALYAKWEAQPGFPADDSQTGNGNRNDSSGIGLVVIIGVIVSIVVFGTVCVVFMIRIKRKTDKGHPIVQGLPDSYKVNKQRSDSIQNASTNNGYTSNLETREGVQEMGKFLGGMSGNITNDTYSNHSSTPHVIPSDNAINANELNNNENSNENAENVNNSQNNVNNTNGSSDQDNNNQ